MAALMPAKRSDAVGSDGRIHTLEGFVMALDAVIELRDPYTALHMRRVGDLCRAIAIEMGDRLPVASP